MYNKCFPLTTLSRKKIKDKHWMTKEIELSIRRKNKLYRQHLKKPNDIELYNQLKAHRRLLSKVIRDAKRTYYRDRLTRDKTSIQQMWKVYSELIGKGRKNSNRVDKLVVDGKEATSDKDIADMFNSYFSSIGSNLANKFPQTNCFVDYLHGHFDDSMFVNPLGREELLKLIKALDSKKACGIDDISPKMLSHNADLIVDPLLHIINLSLNQGIFPSKLKLSKVIPLYKKDLHTNPGNYRPVSLLSIFSKIIEKVMHSRLYSFLDTFHILFDLQFGFRRNHSTILALIEIVDNIRKEIDRGNSVIGIYLDLSKAFDTVNHEKLLLKLSHYGVRGVANKWFKSYLEGRSQKTYVNNAYSEELSVNVGVPQGSVLGPLLFLMYVNDIAHVLPDNNLRLFADDTNVFITGNNIESLQLDSINALTKLHKWFSANMLSLNISKTCFTLFSKRLNSSNIKISLGDTEVPEVAEAKYLGVFLDKDLSFTKHTSYIKSKLTKLTSVFYYISDFIDESDIRRIYFAYVFPYIKYGVEIYGLSSQTNRRSLQGIQNKLLKILCKSGRYDSPSVLYKQHNILNVVEISIFFILRFVFRQLNGLLPTVFRPYFTSNAETGLRRHRSENKLHVPYFRLEYGRKSIQCLGARLYNKLPEDITSNTTFGAFKGSLKRALQEQILTSDFLLRK